MPNRLASLAILLFWAASAAALIGRDVLPELLTGPPPDLRDVANASDPPGPTVWSILVPEEGATAADPNLRAIGQATTETQRQADGHVRFVSDVWFDSGSLLQGTPFESAGAAGERLEIRSFLDVDEVGNLYLLRSSVRLQDDPAELLTIEGHLEKDQIVVRAKGPALPWAWQRSFPYQARGMVQNSLGPMDRIPGLHLGQRWESQVVSPLTGRMETVRAEVEKRNVMIHWGEEIVPCYELATQASGVTARTWARMSDGLVIRQEVPLLFVKLVLDRGTLDSPGFASSTAR